MDRISKLNYSQNVYVVDNIDQLRAASAARTDTSTIFKLLDENALRLKNRGDMTIASLNLDKLMKEEKIRENESEKFTLLNNRTTKLVPTPSADFSAIDKSNTSESVLQERQEEWFRSIRKDIYLEECAQIVQDMIRTSNIKVAKSKN